MPQQIGSVASNLSRISGESDDSCSYNTFVRRQAEDRLWYLRDTTTPDEFDELVDTEIQRLSATNTDSADCFKGVAKFIKQKMARLARIKQTHRVIIL
jgi:hypothetical protein